MNHVPIFQTSGAQGFGVPKASEYMPTGQWEHVEDPKKQNTQFEVHVAEANT